jgi:DMSO/TMAO reductase YedYZ heme-binding membrane subunit
MEALFGFDWWDVGIVVLVLLGLLAFVTSVEKGKRRSEQKRWERHNR